MKNPLFASSRLLFSVWKDSDLEWFAQMNADKEVMQFFPKTLTKQESADFLKRLQKHQDTNGYCYYKVVEKQASKPIGFIGLAYQTYDTHFTPATDIGWRLKKEFWGKGYATEGAQRCLDFAFQELDLNEVISTCIVQNKPSENVMQKMGMQKQGHFQHPRLVKHPEIQNCVWYKIQKKDYKK